MAPSAGSSTGTSGRRTPGWRSKLTVRGRGKWAMPVAFSVAGALVAMAVTAVAAAPRASARPARDQAKNAGVSLVSQGKRTFRFDTFGDQTFWGGTLHLNHAIEGKAHGGVGPGL